MRVLSRSIICIDGLLGGHLDKGYNMTIKRGDHGYTVDIHNKDKLVKTEYVYDCQHTQPFISDMCTIWGCMIMCWILGWYGYDVVRDGYHH